MGSANWISSIATPFMAWINVYPYPFPGFSPDNRMGLKPQKKIRSFLPGIEMPGY
jgi:hypothetical protein